MEKRTHFKLELDVDIPGNCTQDGLDLIFIKTEIEKLLEQMVKNSPARVILIDWWDVRTTITTGTPRKDIQ